MNLYQATQLARLESHVDEDGEINIEAWKSAEIALIEKQRATVAYVKNQYAMADMVDNAIKQLTLKKKAIEARADSLKSWLAFNMREAGVTEISADNGTFSANLYIDRDTSVLLDPEAKFAPELCNEPKPPEPSKTKIKAAIEAGQAIAGASIVPKDRLTIK